jgi:rod shape-determining protein MreC
MSQLFGIIYNARHLFLFLFLQIISFYLISKNRIFWDVTFFNSTNSLVAKSLETSQNVKEYINLSTVNEQLVAENKGLREQLTLFHELKNNGNLGYKPDSSQASRFSFSVAKVIASTTNLANNYITIDKGTKHGLKPGMGVISPQGIVGQIMSCNENYARVSTILHADFSVSGEIKNKKLRENNQTALGIGKWDGSNSKIIKLNTVDRFKPVFKNDSVVTSLQNSVFPPNILIGKISGIKSSPSEAFFNIDVKLSTDFSNLVFVYIVNNKLINQQKEIEEINKSK